MEISLDQNNYDSWLQGQLLSGNFLQGSLWRRFLHKQNKNFWALSIKEADEMIGYCLLYENKLGLGRSYLYAPKGPVFLSSLGAEKRKEASRLLLSRVRDITITTKKYQEVFFRFEPLEKPVVGRTRKSVDIQPRETWWTDLLLSGEKILAQSHPKTRYNIILAKKRGVQVFFSRKQEDVSDFLVLLKKTAERNKLGLHSDVYYRQLWQTLIEEGAGELALARLGQETVAANLLVRFGPIVTYLHGASDYQRRSVMAPHLLHWESIKYYQEQGCKIYDWWGVAPEDGSKSSWRGISRFKQGFAGRRFFSAGTHDFIYDPGFYNIYNLTRRLWRAIR